MLFYGYIKKKVERKRSVEGDRQAVYATGVYASRIVEKEEEGFGEKRSRCRCGRCACCVFVAVKLHINSAAFCTFYQQCDGFKKLFISFSLQQRIRFKIRKNALECCQRLEKNQESKLSHTRRGAVWCNDN